MAYRRLTRLDIEQIEYLSVRGLSNTAIAAFIGCSYATVAAHVDEEARERYRARLLERCREERQAA